MTIIIGALCDKGKTVIFAADKLVLFPIQSVVLGNIQKGLKLTDNCMLLLAGIPSNAGFVFKAHKEISGLADVESMADCLARNYRYFFMDKIVQQFLPYIGFKSFDDFQSKQATLHNLIVEDLKKAIYAFNLNVEIILGGKNKDGSGHIFQITHPGTFYCHDAPGFFCAGIGANRAYPIFEFCNYSVDLTKEKALGIIFLAKKRTESLGGIGSDTDIWIIDEAGVNQVNDVAKNKLEKNYKEFKISYEEIIKDVEVKKEETEAVPIRSKSQ